MSLLFVFTLSYSQAKELLLQTLSTFDREKSPKMYVICQSSHLLTFNRIYGKWLPLTWRFSCSGKRSAQLFPYLLYERTSLFKAQLFAC